METNPLFIALLIIIVSLLIVIIVFADIIKAAAYYKGEQEKSKKSNSETGIKTLLILFILGSFSNSLFAQAAPTMVTSSFPNSYWGLDGFTFYLMLTIIAFEICIAWVLYNIFMQLLGFRKSKLNADETEKVILQQPSFIEKINASVAIEKESDILLDHNYDGIQELDNNLPPWWKYGFYFTILVAIIYLINFHVIKTGKLQEAEYEDQLTQAKYDMEEYRKKSSNLVDENNAVILTDNESLNSGKTIYMENCAACHGQAGEGGVGPNFTDDYWIHKGGIKDIFKTIKYGFPEKGMKSWQQDLGAKQIHEVSSFIKSLRGTNPPNAKEKQGELYIEENTNDSTKTVVDISSKVVLKEK